MSKNHNNDNKLLIWGLILTFSGIGSGIGVIFLLIYAYKKILSKYSSFKDFFQKGIDEALLQNELRNKDSAKVIYAQKIETVNNDESQSQHEDKIKEEQKIKEESKNYEYSTQEILDKLSYYNEKNNLTNEEILEKISILNKMLLDLEKRIDKTELKNDIKDINIIIEKMLKTLKNKKSKIKKINNFTTYYLPVTLKILIKYDEVENLKLNTSNSKEFMNTVEEKIKMIKDSFNKQLESLFVDDFDDIEAELNVLETMLKSDGYTDIDDFNLRKKM